MTDDRIDYHRNRLRGVPLADLDRMLGEVLRDVAREAAEVERARVLQAGVPGRWADIVEQRLLTWRQRFTNRSGDQLALDDFMDQQSIDDLVDFVCDEHAAPHPPSAQAEPTIDINIKIAVPANWSNRLDMQWIVEREIHADRWSWSYAAPQAMNTQADAIEALRMALDALSCTGESHDPGHRCTHCDEYVDRNSVVRKLIRAVLAAQGGDR